MKRETWLAVTAALALAAFGGTWFAIKAPELADPGEPSARPQDPLSGLRAPPSRRFYAPSVDHALMEVAARRPLFNQRRESYGTAASLALHPVASPDPSFTLAPLREPAPQPLTGAAGPPESLASPAPDSGGAVIETSALTPPPSATTPASQPASPSPASPNDGLRIDLSPRPAATPTPPPTPVAAAPMGTASPPASTPVAPTPPVRTPAPSAPAASGPPPTGPSIHPASLALAAVFPREGGRSAALIRLPDNSIIEGGVGATVGGWRIEAMTAGPPSSVTIWNGRERVTLRAGR